MLIKQVFNEEEFYQKYVGKITCAYKKDLFIEKGKYRVKAKRTTEREKYLFKGITDDCVLIECPLDMLAIEFEKEVTIDGEKLKATPKEIEGFVKESAVKAEELGLDWCIVSHGGTSPYLYVCNLKGFVENKEVECKQELTKLIVSDKAAKFLDRSNIGKTLIPIINRPHWKETKYNGAIHKIIDGKIPSDHDNKIPDVIIEKMISKGKETIRSFALSMKPKDYGNADINTLDISSVINTVGMKCRGQSYQGENPWHGSTGGMNFTVDSSKNVFYCFRCAAGGGVAEAIALNEGLIKSCGDRLDKDKFIEVLKIAQEKYGLEKPKINEEYEEYKNHHINWIEDEFYDSWGKIKGRTINIMKEKVLSEEKFMLFLGHTQDEIVGKPIQIHQSLQKIPLVSKMISKDKNNDEIVSYKFIDDRIDHRFGAVVDVVAEDFMIYKIIHNKREIIVLSKEKLESEIYKFRGMMIEMNNLSEITKTLKFRSIARIFLVHSIESSINPMEKEELVNYTKNLNWNMEDFRDAVFLHPDGYSYVHPEDYTNLRIAQILSGKYEGYPLHSMVLGPAGTGKTMELECLDYKFREDNGILEAGNSTPKALIPSFKEKPASPGYVLSCNRIALIDELLKMIENGNQQSRYQDLMASYLGQLNMLLEHKKRYIGSGNDNSIVAQSTSKVFFSSNPLRGKDTLYSHIGIIDETTLSRMIIWVQDKEHIDYIDKKIKIKNNNIIRYIQSSLSLQKEEGLCTSEYVIISTFKNIYDSCAVFLSDIDNDKVRILFEGTKVLVHEELRRIWTARGLHHMILILDGLVKYRCLFKDFDSTFKAIDEDYDTLNRIVVHMLNTWHTNFRNLNNEVIKCEVMGRCQ